MSHTTRSVSIFAALALAVVVAPPTAQAKPPGCWDIVDGSSQYVTSAHMENPLNDSTGTLGGYFILADQKCDVAKYHVRFKWSDPGKEGTAEAQTAEWVQQAVELTATGSVSDNKYTFELQVATHPHQRLIGNECIYVQIMATAPSGSVDYAPDPDPEKWLERSHECNDDPSPAGSYSG